MRYPRRLLLVALFAVVPPLIASAQDKSPAADPPAPDLANQPPNEPRALTGKERLGKKWMDEQRIDNCKVPIDKRGTKARPSACPESPAG